MKGEDWAVYPLGERALVYGRPSDIRGLIEHPAKDDGNLAAALRLAAGKHSVVCAANVKAIKDAVGARVPDEAEDFKPLLEALYGTLTLDVGAELRADVKLMFASEKDAMATVKLARSGLRLARKGLQQSVDEWSKQKGMNHIVGFLMQLEEDLAATQIEQEGKTLQASVQLKVDVANVDVILAEAAPKVREAANRAQSQNNLKQMVLAMHSYNSTYGTLLDVNSALPTRFLKKFGHKPQLSWRVAILPFIGQQNLYHLFTVHEPWDSPNNIKLLGQMPKIYKLPGDDKTPPDHTHYQVFVGNGAAFEKGRPTKFNDFRKDSRDGTPVTILIVEAARAVPWTKPEDVEFDPNKPIKPLLGGYFHGGFHVAQANGLVRFVTPSVSERTLKAAITRHGGDPDW